MCVLFGCGQCDDSGLPPPASTSGRATHAANAAEDHDPALCARARECCIKVYSARKSPSNRCEELGGKDRRHCEFALGLARKLGAEVGVKCD